MKRVKFMLMAILVLAIAGGTLAFKAKFGEIFYCTAPATTVDGNWTCIDPVLDGFCLTANDELTAQGLQLTTICYAEPEPSGDPCPDDKECQGTTFLQTFENP